MKYLKMIVTNPWIVLLLILSIYIGFRVYDTYFDFKSFTLGLLIVTIFHALLAKIRQSIHKEQMDKLDKMSRASAVILCDEKGNQVKEDNEEYTRGFREASMVILRDLE